VNSVKKLQQTVKNEDKITSIIHFITTVTIFKQSSDSECDLGLLVWSRNKMLRLESLILQWNMNIKIKSKNHASLLSLICTVTAVKNLKYHTRKLFITTSLLQDYQVCTLIFTPHTHTHQYGPNKIFSHTIEPTTMMYFNWLF
jgi:hypothetical protein